MKKVWVLWRCPWHRVSTCVQVPEEWLTSYRKRVVSEWGGVVLGVYRKRAVEC